MYSDKQITSSEAEKKLVAFYPAGYNPLHKYALLSI